MDENKNSYSYKTVMAAIREVSAFPRTTLKKVMHYTQVEAIRQMLYRYTADFNCLFDPEYNYGFIRYKRAVEEKENKNKLDNLLGFCLEDVQKDLKRILYMGETGEVNIVY